MPDASDPYVELAGARIPLIAVPESVNVAMGRMAGVDWAIVVERFGAYHPVAVVAALKITSAPGEKLVGDVLEELKTTGDVVLGSGENPDFETSAQALLDHAADRGLSAAFDPYYVYTPDKVPPPRPKSSSASVGSDRPVYAPPESPPRRPR